MQFSKGFTVSKWRQEKRRHIGKREDCPGERLFACNKVRETLAFVLKNNSLTVVI